MASALRRLGRAVVRAFVYESSGGAAAEVVGYANALPALAAAAGAWALASTAWIAIVAGLVVYALLRLALAHRITIWIAAVLGTLAVAALVGVLAWVFAHFVEAPWAPPLGAVLGVLAGGALPGWAYGRLIVARMNDVPDSLIESGGSRGSLASIPPSH